MNTEIEAVVAELNWLVARGIVANYAIGGAVGAFQYIEPGFTEDLDVFVIAAGNGLNTLDPFANVWAALLQRGARFEGGHLVIKNWHVQFLAPASQLYEEAITQSRAVRFGNEIGRVMAPDYLAAIALETGRGKDYVRVDEFLSRKVIDKAGLMALVKRFNLAERWKTFETRFLASDA